MMEVLRIGTYSAILGEAELYRVHFTELGGNINMLVLFD